MPHEVEIARGRAQSKMVQTQELVSSFQVRKKIIFAALGRRCFACCAKLKKKP